MNVSIYLYYKLYVQHAFASSEFIKFSSSFASLCYIAIVNIGMNREEIYVF